MNSREFLDLIRSHPKKKLILEYCEKLNYLRLPEFQQNLTSFEKKLKLKNVFDDQTLRILLKHSYNEGAATLAKKIVLENIKEKTPEEMTLLKQCWVSLISLRLTNSHGKIPLDHIENWCYRLIETCEPHDDWSILAFRVLKHIEQASLSFNPTLFKKPSLSIIKPSTKETKGQKRTREEMADDSSSDDWALLTTASSYKRPSELRVPSELTEERDSKRQCTESNTFTLKK